MTTTTHKLAIIMAGGAGTRLWPASFAARPKHVIPGLGADGASLLQATLDRIEPLIPATNVRVVTTAAQVDPILSAVPSLTRDQMIVEPEGKNTAPCIALVAAILEATASPDTMLCILPADHAVADHGAFLRSLHTACELAAARDTICTLGIRPSGPSTGYGYMQHRAIPLPNSEPNSAPAAYEVARFTEKPDADTAARFLADGHYVWNAGIFVMTLGRLARDLHDHCASTLRPIQDAISNATTPAEQRDFISRAYAQLDPAPIDIALMEKLDDLCVVDCDAGWSDLGSWSSVASHFEGDAGNHVRTEGADARTSIEQSDGCLVWNEGAKVGVLGMENVAVIVANGRVLVCPLDRTEEIKRLVGLVERDD